MKEIGLLKRNQLIVDNIKKRDDKKIVIIYGKKHFKGIKNLLNN